MDHRYKESWSYRFVTFNVIVSVCFFGQTSFAFLVLPSFLLSPVLQSSSSSSSSPSSHAYTYHPLHASYPPAFLPDGFTIEESPYTVKVSESAHPRRTPKEKIEVTSVQHLKDLIRTGYRLKDLKVEGDTKVSNAPIHPAVKALYDRKENSSEPGQRKDGKRIALAVEGGGMRGCVSAWPAWTA